jgi:hypothetical protein
MNTSSGHAAAAAAGRGREAAVAPQQKNFHNSEKLVLKTNGNTATIAQSRGPPPLQVHPAQEFTAAALFLLNCHRRCGSTWCLCSGWWSGCALLDVHVAMLLFIHRRARELIISVHAQSISLQTQHCMHCFIIIIVVVVVFIVIIPTEIDKTRKKCPTSMQLLSALDASFGL